MSKLTKKLTALTINIPSLVKPIIRKIIFGRKNLIAAIFLLGASFIVYFWQYNKPDAPYWDENYHIASAEKYIEGVYFMEPHPPLGKLIIALSEKMMGTNKDIIKVPLTETDFIEKIPDGYTFRGARFLPTLFSALTPVLIFLIIVLACNNTFAALAVGLIYLLDNALVLHLRGAMLDGIQLFFILLSLAYFIYLFKKKVNSSLEFLLLGFLIGLGVATKLNSLFLILLYPILAIKNMAINKFMIENVIGEIIKTLAGIVIVGLTFTAVFYIHFSLGKKISNNQMKYSASPKYIEALENYKIPSLEIFPTALMDNIWYAKNYEKNVPKLDLCKKDENGGLPVGWPLGIKAINYRWEKFTNNNVSYLYLQGNPLVWLTGLLGIILSLSLIINRFIFRSKIKDTMKFRMILIFSIFYISYMLTMLKIERVMYLYHYFIPLTLSLILAGLIFDYLFFDNKAKTKIEAIAAALLVLVFLTFIYYSPFAYFKPLSCNAVKDRAILKIWQIKCVE